MNLHALRLFHTIAAVGSVTRAAEALRISQPAVTAQVRKFERELGIPLFVPKGRGALLTDAGDKLAELAGTLFSIEQKMESLVRDYADGKEGKLRIASTYLPANFLIPTWVARFKQRYERVDVEITTTNSRGAFDLLLRYDVDIAVHGGGLERYPDIVKFEELFQDDLWFVVAPDHRYANQTLSLDDMMNEPFVMREEGSSTRARLFALCQTYNVSSPRVALQFSGQHEAIRAVISGYGATFVSSLAVRDYVERGELSRVFVLDVELKNSIAIFTRRNEHLSTAVANFIEMTKEEGA